MRPLAQFALLVSAVACSPVRPAPMASVSGAPVAAPHSQADIAFVRDMIVHHGQALTMSELAQSRTALPPILMLAERIAVSQRDEIQLMEAWLRASGHEEPADHHHGHSSLGEMAGMASETELGELREARGDAFNRLFLTLMIRHHEGALRMVAELLQSPGAAQRSDIYRIVSEIDADQRAEIARMRALLNSLPSAEASRTND